MLDSILPLSSIVGSRAVVWLYDPIFITNRYSISYQLRAFGKIANDNQEKVKQNRKLHDPNSPFLIGGFRDGDKIVEVQQESYLDSQMSLF